MTLTSPKGLVAVLGLVALVTTSAVPAGAASFSFMHLGGFTIGTQQNTNEDGGVEFFNATGFIPSSGANSGKATYHEIGWGCQGDAGPCALDGGVAASSPVANTSDRSALQIFTINGNVNSVVNPGVDTGWTDITVLFHYNRSIEDRSSTLTGIDIDSLLLINPGGVSSSGMAQVGFTETFNEDAIGDCANPTPAGTACDDFFTFSNGVFATIDFSANGVNYQAQFQLIVPQTLTNCAGGETDFANCVASNTPNGAAFDFDTPDRLYTGEGLTSEGRVQLRIVELQEIPNPGTLLLLGLAGLAGLAARGRFARK